MNRTTGTSILVFGIVLGVIGAVMYWAVTANTDGFDINTAGLILFWVGVGTTLHRPLLVPHGQPLDDRASSGFLGRRPLRVRGRAPLDLEVRLYLLPAWVVPEFGA